MSKDKVATEAELPWGVIRPNRWEMLRLDRAIDRDGVVREVDLGVEYVLEGRETSGVMLPFPRWRKRADGYYEMDLGEAEPPRIRTFVQLRATLHKRPWRGGEPELLELDELATRLLRVVGELHAAGFGIGLLQPANVIVMRGRNGRPSIVLPDFGFVRFRGMLPEWMRPDVPFRLLWDKAPEWMNERCFDRARYPRLASKFADTADRVEGPGWNAQADLRTVARLLAWVLAPDEVVRREIPSRDRARWSKAEVWSVLKDATEEKLADAEAFAQALENETAKPSRHFIEQIEPETKRPPWWKRWALPFLSGAALLACVAAVYLWLLPTKQDCGLRAICPECSCSSPLQELSKDYLSAAKEGDPTKERVVLAKMFDSTPSPSEGERICRDRLLDTTLQRLDDQLAGEREKLAREREVFYKTGFAGFEQVEAKSRQKEAELNQLKKSLSVLRGAVTPKQGE